IRETSVPDGRLYLLSDNRVHRGQDSRSFGTVDATSCRGTIFMRFRPTPESQVALGHAYFDIVK
ncbi:MAG: hypothetical protein H5U40_09715, partial [Polyangiaceae bacterium]|nr:hypothetical protein [Polyangiaceae bacterium]